MKCRFLMAATLQTGHGLRRQLPRRLLQLRSQAPPPAYIKSLHQRGSALIFLISDTVLLP